MADSALQFYDNLAESYHLLFEDWRETVQDQGAVLDRLIRAHLGEPPLSVLDCSCGIGTQAIGLALRGYRVYGTDLSPEAVDRARREAPTFGVDVTFEQADFRELARKAPGEFDVVLSWDNSLPHLLNEADLNVALKNMHKKLRVGGLLLVGTRDYDKALRDRPQFVPPVRFGGKEGDRIVFQMWDWKGEGPEYQVHEFILRKDGEEWKTLHQPADYRALPREELGHLIQEAGFSEVSWHRIEDESYPQPVVAARKR